MPFWSYIATSLTNYEPLSRIIKHLTNYVPTFSAVHRTNELLSNFEKLTDYINKYGNEYSPFYEILPSCLPIIQGKSKRFDIFYAARENIKGSTGQTVSQYHQIILRKDFYIKPKNPIWDLR